MIISQTLQQTALIAYRSNDVRRMERTDGKIQLLKNLHNFRQKTKSL